MYCCQQKELIKCITPAKGPWNNLEAALIGKKLMDKNHLKKVAKVSALK